MPARPRGGKGFGAMWRGAGPRRGVARRGGSPRARRMLSCGPFVRRGSPRCRPLHGVRPSSAPTSRAAPRGGLASHARGARRGAARRASRRVRAHRVLAPRRARAGRGAVRRRRRHARGERPSRAGCASLHAKLASWDDDLQADRRGRDRSRVLRALLRARRDRDHARSCARRGARGASRLRPAMTWCCLARRPAPANAAA